MYALFIESHAAMATTANAECRILKNICVERFTMLHMQSPRRE